MGEQVKHTEEFDTEDARYTGMYLGEVVSNEDELGLGRIRVLVPGLLEPESCLALPIGAMFGVKNGVHWVPEVGANVVVWLHQGDVDHPYYMAGPFGSPGGESDVPEQAPKGSVDHVVVRWRDFVFTLDGTDAAEKVTLEDLGSGTKLEIERATGDYLRDVEGSEVVAVKTNRSVTVEEGDETHDVTLGKRTTTIEGNDERTITTGDKIDTVAAGNETKTVTAGSSTESVPAGTKTVTAGLNVLVTAGVNMTLLAGSAMSLTGASMALSSGAGPSTVTSGGLLTRSFLGGILETVVGAVVVGVTGAVTYTVSGIFALAALVLNLGLGPLFKPALNSDMIAAFNAHTHGGVTAGAGSTGAPVITITPGGAVPFKREDMESANVNVS